MAKISTNNIPNIEADWGLDEKTGLPYSGQAVQKFIKDTLNEKTASVYYDETNSVLFTFKSDADKELWLETKDDACVLSSTPITFSGNTYNMECINLMDVNFGDTKYISSTSNIALLELGFKSWIKRAIDSEFTETFENAYFTIKIDRGNTGHYDTILNKQLVVRGNTLSYNIRKELNPGQNVIEITIVGQKSNSSTSVIYNFNLTSMYIADADFRWYNTYVENQPYSVGGLYIGGDVNKKIHIKVSNEELGYLKQYDVSLGTSIYTTNAYYYTEMEFPDTGSGIYSLEIWVDTDGFGTEHLFYDIICVSESDSETAKFVAINNIATKVDNFASTKVFDYCVYDCGSTIASPELTVSSDGKMIINESLIDIPTNSKNSYVLSLELETEETDIDSEIIITNGNVIDLILPVDNSNSFPATKGAIFYLNAGSRNNSQVNKESIINSITNEEITTEWTGLTWIDGYNGWTVDENDRKTLLVPAMSKANINYQPLSEIPATGKTIEFVFKTSNIANYDEPIIQILEGTTDSFKGILIRPTQIIIRSRDKHSDLNQSYNFKEEEVIDLIISVVRNYKTTYGNLAMIYANGVKVCEFEFDTSDDWTTKANVILGSNYADLYLYKMRVYNTAFNSNSAITNYINSLSTPEEKQVINTSIKSIVDDSGNISFGLVSQKYNTMVVEMTSVDEIPHYGWEKERRETCNFEMIYPDNPDWNFKIDNVGIEGQGTTSMNYWLWNLRIRLDKSDNAIITYNGKVTSDNSSVWFDGENNHPKLNRITAKKNYASSMHSHKMGATGAFNDLHEALGLTNEAEGRVAVYQYPVYAFQKILREGTTDDYVYRFIGLYTIGPDKGDKATFGYNNKTYKNQLIHLEGKDHGIKGVGFNYPWSELKYVSSEESICVDKGNNQYDAGWEVGASGSAETESEIQTYLDQEFKPAYESSYNCSTMILGTADSIDSINSNPDWGKQKTSDGHLFDRFDIWIDGEYDLYFFSKKTNKYEKNGINLLTQLNISEVDLSELSIDEKNELFKTKRRDLFKSIAQDYWDIDDCLFCYCFLLLFGATDNFQKNSYPYKFGNLVDGHRWRWRQDDLDTIFDIDNQGHATKKYSIEAHDWTDDTKAAYVFKGEDSTFWRLLGECYESEIKQMMHNIFGKMEELSENNGNRLEKLVAFVEKYFWNKAQNYFTKSAYNVDGETSYEEAWPQYKSGNYVVDVHPLDQAMGGHLEAERDWVEKRLIYMMSKFQYGAFNNYTERYLGVLTFRTQTGQTFELTPSMDIYPTVLLGQGGFESCGRIKDGETGVIRNVGGNNTNIYLMGADYLKDIGDLSNITVEPGANVTLSIDAKRIDRIKIGDEDASKVTTNLATLEVGNCPSVKIVDARNVSTLTGNIDLTRCPRLQEAYFGGTNITGVSIPNGSTIKKLQLPGTITTLKLLNLQDLESIECDDFTNINYLWIENCPKLKVFSIINQIYNSDNNSLKDIRLVGFDTTIGKNEAVTVTKIIQNLDKNGNQHIYNGIDSKGESQINIAPIIEGRVFADGGIYQECFDFLNNIPNLNVSTERIAFKFKDPEVEKVIINAIINKDPEYFGITTDEITNFTGTISFQNNKDCETFEEFEMFVGVKSMWNFYGCSNLKILKIPDNITSINRKYISGCKFSELYLLGNQLISSDAYQIYAEKVIVYAANTWIKNNKSKVLSNYGFSGGTILYEGENIVTEIQGGGGYITYGFINEWSVYDWDWEYAQFSNCTITNDLEIKDITISRLTDVNHFQCAFWNVKFLGNVTFNNCIFTNTQKETSSVFYRHTIFSGCTFNEILVKNTVTITNPYTFNNNVVKKLVIDENSTLNINKKSSNVDSSFNWIYLKEGSQINIDSTAGKISCSYLVCYPDSINNGINSALYLVMLTFNPIINVSSFSCSNYVIEHPEWCLHYKTYTSGQPPTPKLWVDEKIVTWDNLVDVEIIDTSIYNYAKCKDKISSITQKSDILNIGPYAFYNCDLPDLDFSKITTLDKYSFGYTNFNNKSIDLKSVTSVPQYCFYAATNIGGLGDTLGIKKYDTYSFSYITGNITIDLSHNPSINSNSMTGTFYGTTTYGFYASKANINWKFGESTYAGRAYYRLGAINSDTEGTHNLLVHNINVLNIPNTFKIYGKKKNVFDLSGNQITSFNCAEEEINNYFLYYVTGIKKGVFPNVKRISSNSFVDTYIPTLIFSENLSEFTISYYGAPYLKYIDGEYYQIILYSEIPPTASLQSMSNVTVFVPDNAVDVYKSATSWNSCNIYGISEYYEWNEMSIPFELGEYVSTSTIAVGNIHDLKFINSTSNYSCVFNCKAGDQFVTDKSVSAICLNDDNRIIATPSIKLGNSNNNINTVPDGTTKLLLKSASPGKFVFKTYKQFEKPW